MSNIVEAIWKLKPGAQYSFTNEDYSTIQWDSLDGVAPTQAEIDAAIKQIKADVIAAKAKAATDKAALLAKLGINADELKTLLS